MDRRDTRFRGKAGEEPPAPRHARIPRRTRRVHRARCRRWGWCTGAMRFDRGIAGTAHGGGAHARAREPALVQDPSRNPCPTTWARLTMARSAKPGRAFERLLENGPAWRRSRGCRRLRVQSLPKDFLRRGLRRLVIGVVRWEGSYFGTSTWPGSARRRLLPEK